MIFLDQVDRFSLLLSENRGQGGFSMASSSRLSSSINSLLRNKHFLFHG